MNPILSSALPRSEEGSPQIKRAKTDDLNKVALLASNLLKEIPVFHEAEGKGNPANGFGKWVYLNGLTIEGTLIEGKPSNEPVRITYPDGRIYLGKVEDQYPSGKGTLTYPDGAVFEGIFIPHEAVSAGTLRYPDGTTFKGELYNQIPHGDGVLTTPDGTAKSCRWIQGVPVGATRTEYSDGTIMECTITDQKVKGVVTFIYPEGTILNFNLQ